MSISRYPGVISFEDNEISSELFFGRKDEKESLFHGILAEHLIVLYAKSGLGKTSLLQAGIFYQLREHYYYPVSVRFNQKEFSPVQAIVARIREIGSAPGNFEFLNIESDDPVHLFNSLEIWSADNKLYAPVLVLDQFEEIFTLEHNKPFQKSFFETLARLLYEMKERQLSLKIVISIREDFLGDLESLSGKIPSIFFNRFRLEPLKKTNAEKAIVRPGSKSIEGTQFLSKEIHFDEDAKNDLLNFLSLKRGENHQSAINQIDPIQLQILLSDIEERVINGKITGDNEKVTITRQVLGGEEGMENILTNFYNKQIDSLKQKLDLNEEEIIAIRNVIERDLIINKRRVPMDKDAICNKKNIRRDGIELLIKNKLLREESRGDNKLIEISHDTLIPAIDKIAEGRIVLEKEQNELRLQQQFEREKERAGELQKAKDNAVWRLKLSRIWGVISFLMMIVAIYYLNQAIKNKDQAISNEKQAIEQRLKAENAYVQLRDQQAITKAENHISIGDQYKGIGNREDACNSYDSAFIILKQCHDTTLLQELKIKINSTCKNAH